MSDEMHGYTPVESWEGAWDPAFPDEAGVVTELYPIQGEINTWEQINGWSILDLVESLGMTFTDASRIKIYRKCVYLPPVDTATGWLNHEHFFGWESYVEKYDAVGTSYSMASNSPQQTDGYADWNAWFYTEDGGGARTAVGAEQYVIFYDYFDRVYGVPGGYDGTFSVGMVRDVNQLLAYNRVDPQGGAPGDANGSWPSHPYISWSATVSANEDNPHSRNAYGSDAMWKEYFNPGIMVHRSAIDGEDGGFAGDYLDKSVSDTYTPGLSYLSDDEYDESTTFISVYYYGYSDLRASIYNRYKAIEHTKAKFDLLLEDATSILDSMKLSSSSKWSMQRQNTTAISKNLLSAVFSSGTPMAETYLDDESTTGATTLPSPSDLVTTSFAYDTEESGEGADVGDDAY